MWPIPQDYLLFGLGNSFPNSIPTDLWSLMTLLLLPLCFQCISTTHFNNNHFTNKLFVCYPNVSYPCVSCWNSKENRGQQIRRMLGPMPSLLPHIPTVLLVGWFLVLSKYIACTQILVSGSVSRGTKPKEFYLFLDFFHLLQLNDFLPFCQNHIS